MTPKQALKFLIKEHVKQLLVAEEYTMSGYGPQAVADDRWPDGALKSPARKTMVPPPQEQWASVAPKTVPAPEPPAAEDWATVARRDQAEMMARRAEREERERNEDDDKALDRVIEWYNNDKRGNVESSQLRVVGMSPARKQRKAAALKKAEQDFYKRAQGGGEEEDYRRSYNSYHGINGGGSSGG